MSWLALDIGGANIKLADGDEYACSRPFALWQRPDDLVHELRKSISEAPPCDHLVVTMTGELADCFETKAEGVQRILASVEEAADGRHTRVYLVDGRFVTPAAAARVPHLAAAANWHALASYARRFVEGKGILVDVGSTTTDVIGLTRDTVLAEGANDTDRLLRGELLYTGVERSPVCAIVQEVPYRGVACPVAQEFFATARDVYLILGKLPESPRNSNTADGRPVTKANARNRLARMVCADASNFHHRDAATMAEQIATVQARRVRQAMFQVAGQLGGDEPDTVVISGVGEFLALKALQSTMWTCPVVSLHRTLGAQVSYCAPAFALAVLASEGSAS